MGLMLSILVSTVGVIELISFYNRVVNSLRNPPSSEGGFDGITSYYKSQLQRDSSRSPSPAIKRLIQQNSEEYVKYRSSSPYPSFDLTAPRNSICPDFLDNPSISVTEVDEEVYSDVSSKSPSPSRQASRNELSKTKKPYLVPSERKSRSPSPNRSSSSSRSVSPVTVREPALVNSKGERSKSENKYSKLNGPNLKKSSSGSEIVESSYWRRSPSPFERLLNEDQVNDEDETPAPTVERATSSREDDASKTLEEAAGILAKGTPSIEKKKKSQEPFWVK